MKAKLKAWLALVIVALAAWAKAYDPYVDGAKAVLNLTVEDDRGEYVQDALLDVAFQISDIRANVLKGSTDGKGRFRAVGKTIGGVNVWVEKEGYYKTHVRISPCDLAAGRVTQGRRWGVGDIAERLVLKKKRSPVRLTYHSVTFKPFPATNEVVKLDLESLEWCPPYGNGRHDDLHLVFDGWRNPQDWDDYHEHLKVSFPNGADGFYPLSADSTSAFRYAYQAQTNAVYQKELAFRHVHTVDGIKESKKLPPDVYLVYRVRTETNALGQVTHAHYGRIGESFTQYFGLTMKSWFNPTLNDTNLEDARAW